MPAISLAYASLQKYLLILLYTYLYFSLILLYKIYLLILLYTYLYCSVLTYTSLQNTKNGLLREGTNVRVHGSIYIVYRAPILIFLSMLQLFKSQDVGPNYTSINDSGYFMQNGNFC